MKLTKSVIDKIRHEKNGGQDIRWDSEIAGFGLRVYPSGRKKFVLSYRAKGRKHIMQIGPYGVLTVDQARDRARRFLVNILDGGDPMADRRLQRTGVTVADLCNEYMERHAKVHKKSWQDDERDIRLHVKPSIGGLPVQSIQRSDIAALHQRMGQTAKVRANRTLALLSKMFELAKLWGYLDEGAANPARRIQKYKETSRDRWIKPEELPALAQAIDKEENVLYRYYFWLLILTGARKSELLKAKWEDLDLPSMKIKIPDTKAGGARYIPVTGAVLAVLNQIPRFEGNPHIFPGRGKDGHIHNVEKPWSRIRKDAKLPDVRLHDLRRTVGSMLAQGGNSLHLIGRVLGHANQSTTAIYSRFGEDHVRQALDEHGRRLLVASGKAAPAKVKELKPGSRVKRGGQ